MDDLTATLRRLIARIDASDLSHAKVEGMVAASNALRDAVQSSLSVPPGGAHDYPWLRTGELRASIVAEVEGDVAVVGSSSPVAVHQEQGTRAIPPRPFLAPNAARQSEAMANMVGHVVGAALADALRVSAPGSGR